MMRPAEVRQFAEQLHQTVSRRCERQSERLRRQRERLLRQQLSAHGPDGRDGARADAHPLSHFDAGARVAWTRPHETRAVKIFTGRDSSDPPQLQPSYVFRPSKAPPGGSVGRPLQRP